MSTAEKVVILQMIWGTATDAYYYMKKDNTYYTRKRHTMFSGDFLES